MPPRPTAGWFPRPLPDPIVHVVQWIFQRPGWVMISGLVIGAVVAIVVLRFLWKHRRDIWTWLITRSRGTKILMASAVGVFLLAVAGVGYKANDYMEHNNNFCRGCHVFVPAGQPFVRPDTGTYLIVNQLQGKHDTLECHQCHLPDKIAQAQELVLWMVNRPDKVPAHEKVPPAVCKSCHEQGAAKETWQEITTHGGAPGPLRVRFAQGQEHRVPDLPRPLGAPVPAGGLDLRPVGLPPHAAT